MGRGYWHICEMAAQFDHQVKMMNRIIGAELVFQVGHPGIFGDLGGHLMSKEQDGPTA